MTRADTLANLTKNLHMEGYDIQASEKHPDRNFLAVVPEGQDIGVIIEVSEQGVRYVTGCPDENPSLLAAFALVRDEPKDYMTIRPDLFQTLENVGREMVM